jgi:UDP-N-acetylglucosamine diphosphorylase/glucosamine-1-phosphate N-acetyltransferase
MMNKVFLTDSEIKENLFPFTLTRSAADIRIGILTIREKWEAYLGQPVSIKEDGQQVDENAIIVSANIIPSRQFVGSLFDNEGNISDSPDWNAVKVIQFPWHIFLWNDWAIRRDYELITANRQSAPLSSTVQTVNGINIFIEPGAKLSHCIINAESGPVYIGKNAEIMEGAVIRGPFALCEGAIVKMGTTIYGATTVGPYSVVGGEIKNSVIFGYSNKAHGGYLGDSVVGEWCNLGAGTSNSNVKNNAGNIKIYNNILKEYVDSGLQKCGLMMGDYSRAAINTSFNTGTITGASVNVFGEGLMPKFIPSFTWGTKSNDRYEFDKALTDIGNWKKLKKASLTEPEKTQLKLIFDQNQ